MMQRVWMVAARDFSVTVSNKGFLLGILLMPMLICIFVFLGPRILHGRSPVVKGQVAVVDPTGSLISEVRLDLGPLAIAARRARDAGPRNPLQKDGPPIPSISVVEKPATEDLRVTKNWLVQRPDEPERHLAVIAIHPDAVKRVEGSSEYGSYDLYIASRLDENTESVIHDAMRQALVSARLKDNGIDQTAVDASMRVVRPVSVTVGVGGERETQRGFARMLPFLCGILLFMGVIMGGQLLMTSTVEEKSSRVVEVLLAAVSPLELMWGKLLGQLGVGLLIVVVYVGLGMLTLLEYSLAGVIDPMLLVYFVIFYLLASLMYGALMMSVGAAVNQVADAQSLMVPLIILLFAPYALVPTIGQSPNSTLSVAMTFVPLANSFVVLARLASGTPPPLWQVFGAMATGLAGAGVAVWFAAKVFKIGLLMQGKPPSFATLVKWARMA
jgi:ABC-2 type transport system permease protein